MDPDMENISETVCVVHNAMPCATEKKYNIIVRQNYTVDQLFSEVGTQFSCEDFDLVLQTEKLSLSDIKKDKLFSVNGFKPGSRNTLIMISKGQTDVPVVYSAGDISSDDDLALGASASPTENEPETEITNALPAPLGLTNYENSKTIQKRDPIKYNLTLYPGCTTNRRFVGLVNQAMTCYLNSLVQALYMTPEFRNALYCWQVDGDDEKSIPYQLRKLFLNMQTSTKSAVETTDLTKSFGWDSSEAWQQHDVQELCRVMFDALEVKLKNTDQEDLIKSLYEGKMIDYVKCLECMTEKTREDSFLDIPLPVRPFGNTDPYGSIEEALRAFIQPELLDGNNKYFCEKCNKKCDAHKGFKFKKFPYILTLHLKRFDFDYQTLHRIKLNDKITFPQMLNLSSFVYNYNTELNGYSNLDGTESIGKGDDSSTTDSGAALEEDNCSGTTTIVSCNLHNDLQEDDEGIYMSASTESKINCDDSVSYEYELFAIMIHSGSAIGGHYFAYIKEFENGEWFCFNDQSVTPITQEDIQSAFGGTTYRPLYASGSCGASNAYMLMYRQMDPKKNTPPMSIDDFPDYLKELHSMLNKKEQEIERFRAEFEKVRGKVYFYNPILQRFKETKIHLAKNDSFLNALDVAYSCLNVSEFAPIERCRLVAFDYDSNEIYRSLEEFEDSSFGTVMDLLATNISFLLETRNDKEKFEIYSVGGITINFYKVNLKTKDVDGPLLIRTNEYNMELSKKIANKLEMDENKLAMVVRKSSVDVHILKECENLSSRSRVFVAEIDALENTEENLRTFVKKNLSNLTYIFLNIPSFDEITLLSMGITKYVKRPEKNNENVITPKQSPTEIKENEGIDVVDAMLIKGASGDAGCSIDSKRISPLPLHEMGNTNNTSECNSEDSSLSEGDRTLVECNPNELSQISNTSQSPQLSSPEYDKENRKLNITTDICIEDEDTELYAKYYFRIVDINNKISTNNHTSNFEISNDKSKSERVFKIYTDKSIKLIILKKILEPIIGIPSENFKIVTGNEINFTYNYEASNMNYFKEGENLTLKLERSVKDGEVNVKIFYFKLSELNNEVGKLTMIFEHVFKLGSTVFDIKHDIIKYFHQLSPKYKTLNINNCRIWEKVGKVPSNILNDSDPICTERCIGNIEFIVQECEGDFVLNPDENTIVIFVRRWRPSLLELGEFQEIRFDRQTDIKVALSNLSGISYDNIKYAKVSNFFPCTNMSILTINNTMIWTDINTSIEGEVFNTVLTGKVYFYTDSKETIKEVTTEERREIHKKEQDRLDRLEGISSGYTGRRERSLKITAEHDNFNKIKF